MYSYFIPFCVNIVNEVLMIIINKKYFSRTLISSLLPVQSLILMIDIIDNLGMDILPYIVLLIVPLLGRMSDQTENVRLVATNCFATLIRYMPLEVSVIFVSYTEWTKMNSTAFETSLCGEYTFFYKKLPGESKTTPGV